MSGQQLPSQQQEQQQKLRSPKTLPAKLDRFSSTFGPASTSNLVATRSRTEPPAGVNSRSDATKSSEHRSLHKRIQSKTSVRAARDLITQSAIELKPPINFDHLLRRGEKKSGTIRDGAGEGGKGSGRATGQSSPQRRGYLTSSPEDQEGQTALDAQGRRLPLPIGTKDVAVAKAENAKRSRQLRDTLTSTEDTAMQDIRQLDETYYTILEKATVLQNIVSDLQALAEETRQLHEGFGKEGNELARQTGGILDDFDNFLTQEEGITALVQQLTASKEKKEKLDQRLEDSRKRIEEVERKGEERRLARRQRWGVFWATFASLLVLVVALIVARNWHSSGQVERHDPMQKVLDLLEKELISSPELL